MKFTHPHLVDEMLIECAVVARAEHVLEPARRTNRMVVGGTDSAGDVALADGTTFPRLPYVH